MITSLSLPPFNYFIINFFTFSLLFLFLIKKSNQHKNTKLFFFYGWLFGFGYFASSLYWISISLTFDENFKSLIPLTIFIIPGFLSIFFGLISYMFIVCLHLSNSRSHNPMLDLTLSHHKTFEKFPATYLNPTEEKKYPH